MTSQDDSLRLHDRSVLAAVDAQAAGRFGLALELFHESLDHAKALGVRRKIHAARINISSCYLSLGEWAVARTGLPAIILESDEPRHVSAAAAQLAEALMREGRLEKAGHYLRLAAENAERAGDASRVMSARIMQGHLAVMEGRHDEAVAHHAAALAVQRELGPASRATEAAVLERLGYAQVLAGRIGDGIASLRRSLQDSRRSGNVHEQAVAHEDLAFAFLLAGKNAASERHALRSLGMAATLGYPATVKNATFILMELALRGGRDADFERWFARLQDLLPDVRLSRDFFRIFDLSDVINLKEF